MLEFVPLSSLEKVFSDERPAAKPTQRFSGLVGEVISFQLAFRSDCDTDIVPQITGPGAVCCTAFWVEEIPSGNPCYGDDSDEHFLRRTPGLYPDLLRPATAPMQAKAGLWHSLWVEFNCDCGAGDYDVTVSLNGQTQDFSITKIPAELPAQTLLYTNWFHCDAPANYYGVEAFGEEYWAILEKHLQCAYDHGVNFILTPLFTPPLDTQINGERLTTQLVGVTKTGDSYSFDFTLLERWFKLCEGIGFVAYELSHLYTQWGAAHAPKILYDAYDSESRSGEPHRRCFGWETDADGPEYMDFLAQFAAALLPFLEQQGVKERCYIHVSDEPSLPHLETYARHSAFLKKIFPGLPMIDALSDYAFYEHGHIERPIPANDHMEPFIGNVPELWTYYCCSQCRSGESNRFFAMPSWRNRVIGLQLWKFRCVGFLHWGFNFWNSQFSIAPIDPFKVSDAGGGFASGDSYVIYPGENGEPLCSLRLKVFREALQDLQALQLLEQRIGYDATLAIVEQGIDAVTFTEYPRSAEWLLEVRERVNKALCQS